MNCEEINELLYDYTKNEASVREISAIETHLKECAACSSELAHIKGISSLLKASMEEPHPSILTNIRHSIRPEPKPGLAWMRPALAAAALFLAVTGVLLVSYPKNTEVADVPKEIEESYAVVESAYAAGPSGQSEEPREQDSGNYYGSGSSSYSGGYTPVSYIIGD